MSTTLRPDQVEALVARICGEYLEMPGLRLSGPQATRLWGLDATTCDTLLTSLVDRGFLLRTADGKFRMARAGLDRSAVRRRA